MKIYNFFQKFNKVKYIILLFLFIITIFPLLAHAEDKALQALQKIGSEQGPYKTITTGDNDLAGIVGIGIQAFLGLLGVIFLVLMLYAGYNWMIARGEEEKVTKAKDTLMRAIIGLLIVVGAYAISYFVINSLIFSGKIIK
jgi:amino acid transporter